MDDNEARDTLRQMIDDWDEATPAQREAALEAAGQAAKNPAVLWAFVDGERIDPVTTLQQLGARWSPALTRPGPLEITEFDCVICRVVRPGLGCNCADVEFGSDEYFARLDQVHGRRR